MLSALLLICVAMATSAPVAYYVQTRRQLLMAARDDADRAATALRAVIHERPRLWRYDRAKLQERFILEGFVRASRLVIQDERGQSIELELQPNSVSSSKHLLWAHTDVTVGEHRVASVWVGVDALPLWRATSVLGLLFAVVATLLGLVLYSVPTRALRSAEVRIESLMRQLALTLQEEERKRIARDLHDGAGQALTAARLHLLALERGAPVAETAPAIARHLDEAIEEVRRSTNALMPPALAELGLRGALARHCEAFASATSLEVSYRAPENLPSLTTEVETACYRIVQEALSNTARHAGATRARVELEATDTELRLQIEDDGVGFDETDRKGWGLKSLRERAQIIGANFSFPPTDRGVTVAVTIPLARGNR